MNDDIFITFHILWLITGLRSKSPVLSTMRYGPKSYKFSKNSSPIFSFNRTDTYLKEKLVFIPVGTKGSFHHTRHCIQTSKPQK